MCFTDIKQSFHYKIIKIIKVTNTKAQNSKPLELGGPGGNCPPLYAPVLLYIGYHSLAVS